MPRESELGQSQNYYELLGLSAEASPEEIRRRYRELARKYHPDLQSEQAGAHERFLHINEAYQVLGDPVRRASYDLQLRDQRRRTAAPAPGSPAEPGAYRTPAPPPRAPAANPRPPGADPRFATAETRRRPNPQLQELQRLLEDARLAYSRGHLGEARRLCQEILARRRVGPAHELLGDVYARQGQHDMAIQHYTVAAQMQPNSSLIMAKLNRVLERQATGTVMHSAPAPAAGARLGYSLMVTCFGTGLILFLMLWIPQLDRTAMNLPFVSEWTLPQIVAMLFCGMVAGWTLTAGAWIRRFDQIMLSPLSTNRRQPISMGLVLGLFGAVFLPLALGVYLVVAYMQDVLTGSILALFGVAFVLTLGFVYAAPPTAQLQTGLFGGNVLFLSMLLGWLMGDFFRPRWAG